MRQLEEKTISSELAFRGNLLKFRIDQVELPDGNQSRREIIEHPGGVTIIPVSPERKIIMVKQYRSAANQVLLELPAGKLDNGENLNDCALRELKEETGYTAGKIRELFTFYTTPGYSTENLHLFLAEDLDYGKQETEDGEFIEVAKIYPERIPDLVLRGKIQDSKTIVGLMVYYQLICQKARLNPFTRT
ncbi:NUDIX hydrolase [Halanaerobiaceae bacterium Z-7014]|uniref:NUDIX hydrolase n=1 Tax=Halonatronomonas betaini TaxID=2778430 RepID=A0A931AS97_9FIRM|nr:NUDIX hydrolase [Halonatronomonas betaini]MBF8437537.1 NUDIX hydrolase [Halonatronomonas betaini]